MASPSKLLFTMIALNPRVRGWLPLVSVPLLCRVGDSIFCLDLISSFVVKLRFPFR